MALTKITGQVINTATDVTVGVLTVTDTLAIGGTVSIGGTLTYEDVTNIDSVGLITARNGIVVGSGITLSKDGDIFATGVTTSTTFSGNFSGGTVSGTTGTLSSLTVTSSTFDAALIESTSGDANGVQLSLRATSASPADDDKLAVLDFSGKDDAGNNTTYAQIRSHSRDVTNGSEDGDITFHTRTNGSFGERLRVLSDGNLQVPIGGNVEIGQTASSSHANGNAGSVLLGIKDGGGAMSGVKVTNVDAGTYNDQIVTFLTAQGGVSTPTERLRIHSDGNVKVSKNLNVIGIATVGSAVTISESGIEASGIGITCANINGTQIGGRKNIIINGAMNIAQRGTSGTPTNSGDSIQIDRFRMQNQNSGAYTVSQSSTAPDNLFKNSLKLDVTTADTALTAAQYCQFQHRIEAYNLHAVINFRKPVTFSFWVRSNKTGNYSFSLQQTDNSNRQMAGQYTINAADTWEKKIITVPADSSGSVNDDSGSGLIITWGLAYGSDYTGGSLSTNNAFKTYATGDFGAGQGVNILDSTSNEWYLTGVQMEVGEEATDFEYRSFADDYRDCLRYYYESRHDGNAFFNNPNNYASGFIGFGMNGNTISGPVRFPVPMRSTPSVTIIRPSDGVNGGVHLFRGVTGSNGGTDVALSNPYAIDIGASGFLYISASSGITQGGGYLFHIIADAEI